MHFYLHLLFVFSGILFTLAALAWGYRGTSGCGKTLFLFLATESLTCYAYGMNLSSDVLSTKLFWKHVEYLFGMPVAPLMPVLALRVTGYEKRLPNWLLALFFGVPAAGIALNWTNGWHGIYYTRVWLESYGALTVMAKEYGASYAVLFAYLYALVVVACAIFAIRHKRHPILKPGQAVLVLVALAAPLVFGLPYHWLETSYLRHINTMHLGFFVTALVFSFALFGEQFEGVIRALGESERRNRLLLGNANAIFYTIAPDGRFSYVSDSVQQFLNYRADELVGRLYNTLFFNEDVPVYAAFLNRVVRTGELQSGVEYRVRHADGTLRWNTSSIMPVRNTRNGETLYVGVAHDITAAKRTQEALYIANSHLKELIASRETELREAIHTALGASDDEAQRIGKDIHDGLCQELVALFRMADNLDQEQAKTPDSTHIFSAMAQQISHALRLARGISYDLSLCDLEGQTLADALATFSRRFENATGSVIELNCAANLSVFNRTESGHVYRVIREASVNAIRHGKAQHVWIDLVQEPQQLVVSVTNDGVAVPTDERFIWTEGLGIKQMKMRARLLGGTFALRRNAEGKTLVELIVPRNTETQEMKPYEAGGKTA